MYFDSASYNNAPRYYAQQTSVEVTTNDACLTFMQVAKGETPDGEATMMLAQAVVFMTPIQFFALTDLMIQQRANLLQMMQEHKNETEKKQREKVSG